MDVSWTIKKTECWRIDAFELGFWRRLLKVPRTAKRSNQSILKETNPEYLLEGLMLKLKLQYFGHLMRRTDSLEKTLIGKDWSWEEKGTTEVEMVGWHHWRHRYEFEQALGVGDGRGSLACCSPWGHKELDTTEWLNWTDRVSEFFPLLGIVLSFYITLAYSQFSIYTLPYTGRNILHSSLCTDRNTYLYFIYKIYLTKEIVKPKY